MTRQAPKIRQSGVALVVAIFLLVVLAGLAAYLVKLSSVQSQTVVIAMQASRVFNAARSGIEWGAYQATVNGSCGSTTLTLTEASLTGFTVVVDCMQTTHTEGTATVNVYRIEAFAQRGNYGQPDYVSRRIEASITDAG